MNPTEFRMMLMNQYNPDRISLEDAASFFGHPSVGLSVMDDMSTQPTMDLNPMMSIVGGDFSGQAAAALGIPTALIATNPNDIYGLAQVNSLQQQLLQQSAAAAVFQNYSEMVEDDDGTMGGDSSSHGGVMSGQYMTEDQQEIINIDDFVMMTDSNSYDGTDFMDGEKDLSQPDVNIDGQNLNDNLLMSSMNNDLLSQKLGNQLALRVAASSGNLINATTSTSVSRSQRKTRKIEPVSRPGLVLKTPIAYKGNIDPSVIPIQKDGMAVCERCGAIGVKHTFYTKSRRFCSMSCARGELYNLVLHTKMANSNNVGNEEQQIAASANDTTDSDEATKQHIHSDAEQALSATHIKNSNYRFKITDQSKITQITNGFNGGDNSNEILTDSNASNSSSTASTCTTAASLNAVTANNVALATSDGNTSTNGNAILDTYTPKALRLYRDVLPQDELPQIPKYNRLPVPCPQMEKIISIRRRPFDPTHSYDWTPRLTKAGFFAAPVSCFPHAPGYEVWDNIGIDMKVEVENTDCDNLEVIQPGQTPHSFWVATILNICGYKALMRYEGFDDASHDFWVNLCNAEVHSVGWCATRGKPLIPPRSIEKKYKDWKDFLVERLSGARTLPSSFYNKIHDSLQSRFRVGLNLECIDKNHLSQVRLATVNKIVGKRLYLRYFDTDDDFWCHEDSPIIHPVGWATTVGHNLAAPQDYLERMLAGREAMIEVHEDDATIELFKMNFTFEEYYMDGKTNGFVEGMKLEAVDPLNLSSICAATVMGVLKFGYMMIRVDSYQPDDAGRDWFCYHEKSPCIFPVGFCAANNVPLTPPNGYDANTFQWETYLQDTGSIAAGPHLFHRAVPNHGFKVGMSVECADLMDPRLICVATVSRIVGRLLKISFDGWTEEYDQWLDCESPDIYPVGWCVLVNHKLEGPPVQVQPVVKPTTKSKPAKKRKKKLTGAAAAAVAAAAATTKSYDNTVKPRTIALKTNPHLPKLSIKLELKPEHHNASFYEDNNDEEEDDDDFYDDSNSRPSSTVNSVDNVFEKFTNAPFVALNQQSTLRTPNVTTAKKSNSPAPPAVGRKATSYIGNSSVSNSKYIPRLADTNEATTATATPTATNMEQISNEILPDTWNVYDVSQFLRVNDCTAHCDTFSRNKIDGKRLMQLSKDEIITLLGMKVGPALKIYDLIQQLKCKMNPSKSRLHKANKSYL